MLLTQGLGEQPFHNRIVVLVNEWTNSAAEMVANFAAENRLATVVGEKTRGNVLGAMNFKVGGGYWLRLPVFGWFTSKGRSLEGNGVDPDVSVEISPDALADGQDNQMARALRSRTDCDRSPYPMRVELSSAGCPDSSGFAMTSRHIVPSPASFLVPTNRKAAFGDQDHGVDNENRRDFLSWV